MPINCVNLTYYIWKNSNSLVTDLSGASNFSKLWFRYLYFDPFPSTPFSFLVLNPLRATVYIWFVSPRNLLRRCLSNIFCISPLIVELWRTPLIPSESPPLINDFKVNVSSILWADDDVLGRALWLRGKWLYVFFIYWHKVKSSPPFQKYLCHWSKYT